MYKRGVIVGKFRPPHRGHSYLISTGEANCKELYVLVCRHSSDTIPADLRAEWLRQLHPKVNVLVVEPTIPDDDSAAWAVFTVETLGFIPDVVFTSEDYGDPWSKCLGCAHVLVDKERVNIPISGRAIMADPLKHLDFLDPLVALYFVKRVCVVGAESTGTTTLAQDLARYYQTAWVPEYGRVYYEGKMHSTKGQDWKTEEFVWIAGEQQRLEEQMALFANKVLICDTDAFATCLWHERYVGGEREDVEQVAARRNYDLYLLTGDEIPFEQDGTRDGEGIRHAMHERFLQELKRRGKTFVLLTGNRDKRLREAIGYIDALLGSS